MDVRHDLSVFSGMENTGHPNSQQLRPPSYGELCRPPGTVADPSSTLSAGYHSRYLASLPLSTGSTFPFLSNMFPGGALPAAPHTTSFRTPSAPGIGSMRQFWPPTPPPDGYGRYGLNTSLFPLFGSVSPSPDSGTYMTQGLVSRLSTTGHLPHLIDNNHKDQGFFSPGFSLASPLTPSSHVTPTTPYSHIIPSLEKQPTYGHMTLGNKELDDTQESHELNSSKAHIDPYKPDKYSSSIRSKPEKLYDKMDFRKSSPSFTSKEKQEDVKPLRKVEAKLSLHSPNKISPCQIDVNCTSSIKPDILSPPLDSPRSEVPPSPKPVVRRQDFSPLQVNSPPLSQSSTTFSEKLENQCSTCAANLKGVGIATKLRANSKKSIPITTSSNLRPSETKSDTCPSTLHIESNPTAMNTWTTTTAASCAQQIITTDSSGNSNLLDAKEVTCSVSRCPSRKSQSPENSFNHVFQETADHMQKSDTSVSGLTSNFCVTSNKHVTAAVIPTAPKQITQKELVTHSLNTSLSNSGDNNNHSFNPTIVEVSCESANGHCYSSSSPSTAKNIVHKIKSETSDSISCNEESNKLTYSVCPSMCNCCKNMYNKSNSLCKVKDMIKAIEPQKLNPKLTHDITPKRTDESGSCQRFHHDEATTTATVAVTSVHSNPPLKTGNAEFCDSAIKLAPFKTESPILKAESGIETYDCKLSRNPSVHWSKATVLPYNWQKSNSNGDDHQAINLTVSKKNFGFETPESSLSVTNGRNSTVSSASTAETIKITMENVSLSNTGVIGVCHPNSTKISVASSVNKFSSVSATSQPEITTEVHLSSKSSLQTVRHIPTPPSNIKSNIMNVSIHNRNLKSERLNTKRSKIGDMEKVLPSTRGTLATLAPKLTKKVGFLKDGKASHTLSTSSSVSSTSIVFPASVNPCIPVGIAIAQQRQDSSTAATVGKQQSSIPSSGSGISASTTHSNHVHTEVPRQEIVRDQKPQDIVSSSAGSSESTNFLVTPGSTILSRQWESEAVTRATLPSPWVAHGSIVAPAALWIGQGTYATATAPTSAAVPPPLNSVETSPISLPPGGYQLARDSITGHLFLIPAANIVDRTSLWPSYNSSSANTLPVQQLVTQQHHTQFEQVLPQATETEPVHDCLSLSVQQTHVGETAKELNVVDSCCLPSGENALNNTVNLKPLDQHGKSEGKRETSNSVPSVPLASGQTFTFTTFPTNCDPSSFSYVLQSSTVMHLAHTQTTSSIQTESGKRSQGTSPLHCASPSPPPQPMNANGIHVIDESGEEESDNDVDGVSCSEMTQVKLFQQSQSVTTAIQVDMDSQTNSEEDEDESSLRSEISNSKSIEMSDSANQTENIISDIGKCDSESDGPDFTNETVSEERGNSNQNVNLEEKSAFGTSVCEEKEGESCCKVEPTLEILTTETELAPSLPVESQPVIDFIDHHGLNLLVDSIEEFASREKDITQKLPEQPVMDTAGKSLAAVHCDKTDFLTSRPDANNDSCMINQSYTALDTSCTDGLGLLCALAEQRFLEESLNSDNKERQCTNDIPNQANMSDCAIPEESAEKIYSDCPIPVKDCAVTENTFYENFQDPFNISSPASLRACELEMRKRLADLQRKYKEKELELARLVPSSNVNDVETVDQSKQPKKDINHTKRKGRLFTVPNLKCKTLVSSMNRTSVSSQPLTTSVQKLLSKQSALLKKSLFQKKRLKKYSRPLTQDKRLMFLRQKTANIKQDCYTDLSQNESPFKNKSNYNEGHHTRISVKAKMDNKSLKHFTSKKKMLSSAAKHSSSSVLPESENIRRGKVPSLKITSSDKGDSAYPCKNLNLVKCRNEQCQPSCDEQLSSCSATKTSGCISDSTDDSSKQKSQTDNTFKIHSGKSSKKRSIKNDSMHFKKVKSGGKCLISSTSNENVLHASRRLKESKSSKLIPTNRHENLGNSKVPFFDEQAWFIRRSERIFLNDARTPTVGGNSCSNGTKKSILPNGNISPKTEWATKEKKENSNKHCQKTVELLKSPNNMLKPDKEKNDMGKKVKNKICTKMKTKNSSVISLCKKRSHSSEDCNDSRSSASSSSDSESSSQSDNVPLCRLFEQTSAKAAPVEKSKRLSTDSESSEATSDLSEDIPLSLLLGQNTLKVEVKSCILTPSELQDKTRVLILDEGLFYAGHITAIQAPDVYGIILDGERAHRPHIFSREEILNAAVLEIKPSDTAQLPEGCRICAYWSQQYRCLYPGTVAKASSPLPDSSLLYVEFDDGDSGRIPLEDIRMLPPDFPIVSMEPNPLLILGKRRARNDKEHFNYQKNLPRSNTQRENAESRNAPKLKKRRQDSVEKKVPQENKLSKREFQCVQSTNSNSTSNSKNLSSDKTSKVCKLDYIKTQECFPSTKSNKKECKVEDNIKSSMEMKIQNVSEFSGTGNKNLSIPLKPKKHKKRRDDHKHHHRHHHHHHHHHHKKHKIQKQSHSDTAENTVISMKVLDSTLESSSSTYSECHATTLCTEKKSELTVKIKTSPSPHTTHDHDASKKSKADGVKSETDKVSCGSHDDELAKEKHDAKLRKKSKAKKPTDEGKPAKRKDRLPSVEKSKIAAFLPVRQLWRWSGKSYRRPGTKGKAKKEFYRAIQRGKEMLRVGDCAVFLSTGRPHLPYIGRIETMWESWGGKMDVKVKWFYHPEETKSSKKLTQLKQGALFQSPHFDENDVQTISHKCEVLAWEEYQKRKEQVSPGSPSYSSLFDNNDTYYLAGTYDPITGSLMMEPDIPKIPSLSSSEG